MPKCPKCGAQLRISEIYPIGGKKTSYSCIERDCDFTTGFKPAGSHKALYDTV